MLVNGTRGRTEGPISRGLNGPSPLENRSYFFNQKVGGWEFPDVEGTPIDDDGCGADAQKKGFQKRS